MSYLSLILSNSVISTMTPTPLVTISSEPRWFDIVESLGLGIGTVMIGLGAIYAIRPWVEEKKEEKARRDMVVEYRALFPERLFDSFLHIVAPSNDTGTWYLIDDRYNKKHWIEDMETVRALGWQRHKETVSAAKLNSYDDDHSISILHRRG